MPQHAIVTQRLIEAAGYSSHPTIEVTEEGILLYISERGRRIDKIVPWLDIELAKFNPLPPTIDQLEKEFYDAP